MSTDLPKSRKPAAGPSPKRMAGRRRLLRLPLVAAAAFSALALYSLSSLLPHPLPPSPPPSTPPKIYLYPLPRKFTLGVVDSYLAARSSPASTSADAAKYPGNQHSGEWHLYADLIRPDRRPESAVVVVDDPEKADLFYVPFFSSLSLVVNPPGRPPVAEGYSNEAMQEELVEWLESQVYWRRNWGRDHVIICQDPNALYKVVDRVKNSVLLVSDFGRLGREQASLVKDVILPYSHRINPYKGELGVDGRKSLLFFMGNRYRKEVIYCSNYYLWRSGY